MCCRHALADHRGNATTSKTSREYRQGNKQAARVHTLGCSDWGRAWSDAFILTAIIFGPKLPFSARSRPHRPSPEQCQDRQGSQGVTSAAAKQPSTFCYPTPRYTWYKQWTVIWAGKGGGGKGLLDHNGADGELVLFQVAGRRARHPTRQTRKHIQPKPVYRQAARDMIHVPQHCGAYAGAYMLTTAQPHDHSTKALTDPRDTRTRRRGSSCPGLAPGHRCCRHRGYPARPACCG
jgi:hypothetical protein